MKKISFTCIALLAISITSFAQTKAPAGSQTKPAATSQKPAVPSLSITSQGDSASYAFGASVAGDLKNRGVKNLNYALVAKAMEDVFNGAAVMITPEKSQEVIFHYLTAIDKQKHESVITEGDKFLADNAKKPGVTTLPSGLQYEVLTAGTGPKPKATDEVTVHYKGTLLNGKQFDSSYDRGEPATFALNRVIPGWTEGVQQMPTGSKYRFVIPHALAYGERGAGQDIPPYSTLVFEVELIKVESK